MIDDVIIPRVLQLPKVGQHTLPIVVTDNVKLAQKPLTNPPNPKIASTLVGTATGFQFSFNQVAPPTGATNTISTYRVYRNTLNVFNKNLVQTIPHDPTHSGAIVVNDHIVAATGQNYYYWVTSVDTTGQESSPQSAQCGTAVGSTGSTPYSNTTSFTYTSTTTSITWTWTNLKIYRADGTLTGPVSGSQAITGLTANTTYQFLPYWDEPTQTVLWVTGGSGTPTYAFTSVTQAIAAQQNYRNRIPLSNTAMNASTPSSGSGSGGGGGGGGGGGYKVFV